MIVQMFAFRAASSIFSFGGGAAGLAGGTGGGVGQVTGVAGPPGGGLTPPGGGVLLQSGSGLGVSGIGGGQGGGNLTQELNVSGADFSDEQSVARILTAMADAAKRGTAEAIEAGVSLSSVASLNPRRAV